MFTIAFINLDGLCSEDSFENYTSVNIQKMQPVCGRRTIWLFLSHESRKELFGLNVPICKSQSQNIHVCFIDYEKS